MFIKKYLEAIQDPEAQVFVLDEVGFGTSPLRNYSYAPIGSPALLWNKKLSQNITCCATISENCVELLRFFVGGGTRNEVFEDYLGFLM